MQALPQKTTDYIAEQFRAYYARKAQWHGMDWKDARAVIDYLSVAGPAPEPSGAGAIDYARPHVSGSGGRKRPSQQRFERILDKYAIEEDEARWNIIFDDLLEYYRTCRQTKQLRFIRFTFENQLKCEEVCEKMDISDRTFKNYRLAILTAAAVFAALRGVTLTLDK